MKSIDRKTTPSDFGFYKVKTNTVYNNTNECLYVLYTHNVRLKLKEYSGKLYVPFMYRNKLVVLKGDRLYPD